MSASDLIGSLALSTEELIVKRFPSGPIRLSSFSCLFFFFWRITEAAFFNSSSLKESHATSLRFNAQNEILGYGLQADVHAH